MKVSMVILAAAVAFAGCFEGEKVADSGTCAVAGDARVLGALGAACYGNKTCNSGLICQAAICVKGPDAGPDSAPPDLAPSDTATVEASTDMGQGSTFKVVITEIMPDPKAATDSNGEWFELYNLGSATVNINGWTISTKTTSGTDTHKISASGSTLNIKPNHYLVLGAAANTTKYDAGVSGNGGVPVDYSYTTSKITLGNSSDSLMIYDAKGKLVDRVDYDLTKKWPIAEGASMSVKSVGLDNNVATNWCKEKKAWTGSSGDYGSPGMAPGCDL